MSDSRQGQGKTTSNSPDIPPVRKDKDRAGAVGRALKTVYDDMLREDVPQDFLDLLGKLD